MKNLKLILGLVVVMMTTIGVKGQDTTTYSLSDFTITDAYNYNVGVNEPTNLDVTIDEDVININQIYHNEGYDSVFITIEISLEQPEGYISDTISANIGDARTIKTETKFEDNRYFITLSFSTIQIPLVFSLDLQIDYIGIITTKVANTFEYEQTNTTVTSYNKELTIKSSEYQNVDVQIYNMGGQMVNTLTNIELGYADTKINMYDNPNGVYLILVKDNYTSKVEKHKVIVQ